MNRPCVLLFGASARFRDGLHGRLASVYVEPGIRTVNGLGLNNGLLASRLYVPAELISAAFPESVHVNQRSNSVAADPPPKGIELSPGERVRREGVDRPEARLKGVVADEGTRTLRAFVLGRRALGPVFRLDAGQIVGMDHARILVRPDTPQLSHLPRYRRDDDIRADILREIELEPRLLTRDFPALRVDVVDGAVHLQGNVRTPQLRRRIAQRARRVAGVLSVTDELIEDWELELAVAAALAGEPATRGLDLYVFAGAGEIELAGRMSSREVAEQAVLIAARVPGVRSVTSGLVGLGRVETARPPAYV